MVCISGNSHKEDKLGSSRAAWIGAPGAEQQRPKKGAFWRFLPKFEIPKNGSTDERTRAGKRFLVLAVRSGEQHWPVL